MTVILNKPALSELAHYGIKGMKWGVHKKEPQAPIDVKAKGVKIGRDGSIEVAPGASLQRLVRSNGKSLPMKDMTYASLTDYDNSRYVKTIGGKGFFGGGRDQILTIKATKRIKAPSLDEATKLTSDLFLNDAKFRNRVDVMGRKISKKELEQIRKDPTGKTAKAWYHQVNVSMTFDREFDPGAPYIQKAVREHFQKNGFNAVRDENDVEGGIAKAPIIIFSPESSLKVTHVTDITDEIRMANKERLAAYKALGKNWAESQLYE